MDSISALMDGELDDHQAARAYAQVKDDQALREQWHEFHLIGDALRGEPALSPRFNETLSARLAQEPTVLAPRRSLAEPRRITRYALSAAASIAAVAVVGWIALSSLSPSGVIGPQAVAPAGSGVAVTPVVTTAGGRGEAVPASVPSEGRMNEYLFAHQRFSPSTALQGVAPYIRTVSATRSEGR
jgi:sigma-E factor negative regulatory protein RseA